ncbi:predicted protein [Plenodomus lingam JN3]|uniref:Predicted protein n=1 Tax=Leptosphaeria maculans (strain JN3 / isolate v23.1.3 / race Av1-4-5-6-7-8) TaxID=985895 RepID=E4ZMQ0_LEPMJ|nr:predicted protein [Plenodomus lingam JN3]CBX92919.1 predicted protein [Plenodomus lingam JN3]
MPVEARKEKLGVQCEAQCASLSSHLERRVNRISPTKRQTVVKDILNIPIPSWRPVARR